MMKNTLLLLLIVVCSSYTLEDKNGLFEGTIEYTVTYEGQDEKGQSHLCSMYGDKMVHQVSPAGYLQSMYCDKELVQRRWFKSDSNLLFMDELNDTLLWYNASETNYTAIVEVSGEFTAVEGYRCQEVHVELKPIQGNANPPLKYVYYIADDLHVDPASYKDFKDGGYSDILARYPGTILKQIYYSPYYTRIRTATKIKSKSVNLEKLIPDQSFVRVEI